MSGNEITLTIVASVFGLVATILTILQFFKNDKKAGKDDAKEIAGMQTDLVYIKDGIGELKTLIQAQSKEQTEIKIKVQKIEDRVESMEDRLDNIEKKESQRSVKKGA